MATAGTAHDIRLHDDMTIAAAMHCVVSECARHLRENVPGILAQNDMECVHQARVALRRLRSADKAFRHVDGSEQWQKLMLDAQWVAAQLGKVRDLQMLQMQTLPPIAADTSNAIDFAPLQSHVVQRIERAQTRLVAALTSKSYSALESGLQRWIDGEHDAGSADLCRFSQRTLTRRWRRVDELMQRWDKLDHVERHTLRKQLKKLRYAIEFFHSLYAAKTVKKYVKHLKKVQDALGTLNDIAAAKILMQPALRHKPAAHAAGAALGWLSCAERHQLDAIGAIATEWQNRKPFWQSH